MNGKIILEPIVESFQASERFFALPTITDIHYDLCLLRVKLRFRKLSKPIYVTFEHPVGFRVLDEGDLLEFWQDSRPEGWIWVVKSGGWFELENSKQGFVSGLSDCYLEYLVVAEEICMSAITYKEPVIYEPDFQ